MGSIAVTARALADAGSELTLVQWRALVVLAASDGPLTIGDLAREVGASPSGMSRLVRRLVARGYVSSRYERADRRKRRLVVSDRGRDLVARIVALRDRGSSRDCRSIPAMHRRSLGWERHSERRRPSPIWSHPTARIPPRPTVVMRGRRTGVVG